MVSQAIDWNALTEAFNSPKMPTSHSKSAYSGWKLQENITTKNSTKK